MKWSVFHPTHPCAATVICMTGLFALASANLEANDVRVGRYAVLSPMPTPEQINLLSALVTVQFPSSVVTVGQAVKHLLQPSGYRLAPEVAADPSRVILLDLPLPQPHRSLGPIPLQTALETLAGTAFRLVEDPVHRLVSFERCGPINPGQPALSDFGAR